MYATGNPKTKKALKEAVAAGKVVEVFQPGLGTVPTGTAKVAVEGPHYPQAHSWYATVTIENGRIVSVK